MSTGLDAAREALAGTRAWLVGGAVRDRLLGRQTADLDIVVDGDPREAARAVARAAGGAASFVLSEEFGSWRVVARGGAWQLDVEPLHGQSIEEDLALRDFTLNSIAEPLAGGAPIDPLGGIVDLRAGRLRMSAPAAFEQDPLRVLRLVRLAVALELDADRETARRAAVSAADLSRVSAERVFVELRRIVASPRARRGLEMMHALGAMAVVLPELQSLQGVEQNRFHHRDAYGHTLEVFDRVLEITGDRSAAGEPATAAEAPAGETARALEATIGEYRPQLDALLAEPLADEMTRGDALRWGALLHDAAKPLTREAHPGGGVTFYGHDVRGAELARTVLARLRASERLRAHVAALVRSHLRLGFLVHEPQPLARRTLFTYLRVCSPVEVDVTLLSIADRLATRGDRAQESIEAHLRLANGVLGDALEWRLQGPPRPLLRGDQLAKGLGIATGPRVGELLEAVAAAQYAGELDTPEQALAYARTLA
jgi:poly(A) polymerase